MKILLPILVGFGVALVTAPAGVSGAFLLLPFQVSILGLAGPAVSATNLVYNLIATPGGIIRYWREGRLDWNLGRLVIAGTAPGVVVGSVLRVTVFSDPRVFKAFIGFVLLVLAVKLGLDLLLLRRKTTIVDTLTRKTRRWVLGVSLVVGLVGGIYGIGGGSIIAPFLVAMIGMSIYRVAGAALLATFVTSAVGVLTFQLLGAMGHMNAVTPDWGRGALFGVGGIAGSYVGASLQRRLPEYWVKAVLAAVVGALGLDYVVSALRSFRS